MTLTGFADTHNHQFAYLGFGGKAFWGAAYGELEDALGGCTAVHGPGGAGDFMGNIMRTVSLGLPAMEGHDDGDDAPVTPASLAVNLKVPLLVGLEHIEEAYRRANLELALKETSGNVSQAAKIAGVGRAFVQKAMKRYGLRGVPEDRSSRALIAARIASCPDQGKA